MISASTVLLLNFLVAFQHSLCLQYYVSPDPVDNCTCSTNGNTTLSPCYSIQQFCDYDRQMLSNERLVTLLLLPGTHVIDNHTLSAYNTSTLEVRPWDEEEIVVIQCLSQGSITLDDVSDIKLFFIEFASCSIYHSFEIINGAISELRMNSMQVTNCNFHNSSNTAISLSTYNKKVNISVSNCTFSFNRRGLECYGDLHSTFLSITDTLFLSNRKEDSGDGGGAVHVGYVDMKVQSSKFINNTAISDGGAISLMCCLAYIENTTFTMNSVTGLLVGGGAIYSARSALTITGSWLTSNTGGAVEIFQSTFEVHNSSFLDNNNINKTGGAIDSSSYNSLYSVVHIYDSVFKDNTARHGGAIYSRTSKLTIKNTLFKNNIATGSLSGEGGAINYDKSDSLYTENLGFGGFGDFDYCVAVHLGDDGNSAIHDSLFENNTAGYSGGAIYSRTTLALLAIENSGFIKNTASFSGGAISSGNTLVVNGTRFHDNFAGDSGGAIYIARGDIDNIVYNCRFSNNVAGRGGAIKGDGSFEVLHSVFQENYAMISGGGIFLNTENFESATYKIAKSTFVHNEAGWNGGAICCVHGSSAYHDFIILVVDTDLDVMGNRAKDGGGIYSNGCIINFYVDLDDGGDSQVQIFRSRIILRNNLATSKGGGIYAVYSAINVSPNTTVLVNNNAAENEGGGMYLDTSTINTETRSRTLFSHNVVMSVKGKGGGIFVRDDVACMSLQYSYSQCFLSITGNSTDRKVTLVFVNNTATSGSVLYGGMLDICYPDNTLVLGINYFKKISRYEKSRLAIASDPARVCVCHGPNHDINCTLREITVTKMRGGTVTLTLVILNQDADAIPSKVEAVYKEPLAELAAGEDKRKINGFCTKVSYHIFTTETSATLVLRAVGIKYCKQSPLSNITIHIQVRSCSKGLELNDDKSKCTCDRRITHYFDDGVVCNVESQSANRKGSNWLRYDEHFLKLHKHCPMDYCDVTSDTISFLSPDEQCANHHAGVICGTCREGFTVALGSTKCLRCTSRFTFIWLTLVLALAGVVLVALLLVCNMTVSHGTLNGLIFYANVISISGLTGLQNCSIHPILSIFIAWVNLDIGVETCFYPGMDTYQKTWLQFAFPLYIWLLVGAIIVASHYSTTAMRIFGSSNVAILATLFLLSYTKLLKTISTALSFTQVWVGDADNVSNSLVPYAVWYYDGNIEYWEKRHIFLFTVSLSFLIFLFLPYTYLLTFGHCIRSMPVKTRRIQKVIRSTAFISIMDAYHAAYHRKHRYWTGFMLLARCVLFLAFASFNRGSSILANMFITNLVILGILIFRLFVAKIYKLYKISVLELCFFVNLGILSATLCYFEGITGDSSSKETICKVTSGSISISFIIFIGILSYHAYLLIMKTKHFSSVKALLLRKWPLQQRSASANNDNQLVSTGDSDNSKNLPTTSHVELREPLLESTYVAS